MSYIRVGSGEGWTERLADELPYYQDGDKICLPTRGMFLDALRIRDQVCPGRQFEFRRETGMDYFQTLGELGQVMRAYGVGGQSVPAVQRSALAALSSEGYESFVLNPRMLNQSYDEERGTLLYCFLGPGKLSESLQSMLSYSVVSVLAVTSEQFFPAEHSLRMQFVKHWPVLPYVFRSGP